MHFFNPPTRMKLVEVVAGLQSGTDALDRVRTLGAAMGKRVIDAADGPGFIVNRCNRPFFGEALRVVSDGVADVETVDRAVRVGGGFRMGPFELQDLVGIDVALDVARAFDERSFGEPRWRPSPLMAMQVDAGWTGRKAGRGWYSYPDGPPADPDAVAERVEPGVAAIIGDWRIAVELRERARAAGWVVQEQVDAGPPPAVVIRCDGAVAAPDVPCGVLVAAGSLHQLDPNGRAVGFHAVPPMRDRDLVELTAADPEAESSRAVQSFFESLGWLTAWVGDAPGLVLGRLVAQLVNEAFFAVAEGAGGARDIDDGMLLGLNHPLGPLDWGDRMGLRHVLAILDALRAELGEERYRAAPLLRRMVSEGLHGRLVGHGFHVYEDASHDHEH
jgi:3-hydroxybutyryl-CoA dehydrogenase